MLLHSFKLSSPNGKELNMIVEKPNYLEVVELFPADQQMYTISKGNQHYLRTVLFDVAPPRYCVDMCNMDEEGELKPFARCIWSNGMMAFRELETVRVKETFEIVPGSKFNMDEKFEKLDSQRI